MTKIKQILSIGLLSLISTSAFAATATQNFQVTATVEGSCKINSTGELSFGTYDPLSTTDKEATNTISITCSNGTSYSIGLDGGSTGDIDNRAMAGGTDNLAYQIYQDSSHSTVWGNTPGTDTIDGTASSSSDSIDLTGYGVIPAEQDVAADDYSDTITATVTY